MAEAKEPNDKKEPPIDGLVNELRSVLSDLGKESPKTELNSNNILRTPTPPPEPVESSFLPPYERPETPLNLRDEPPNGFGHSIEEPPPGNGHTQPLSESDDFWKGNVLGWPNSIDEEPAQVLPSRDTLPKPGLIDEPESPGPKNVWHDEFGFPLDSASPAAEPPIIKERPLPEPIETPKKFSNLQEPPMNWAGGAPDMMDLLPKPPLPPAEPEEPKLVNESFLPTEKSASVDAFPKDFDVTDEKPAALPDSPDDMEVENLKPKGLIQIACLYPEGHEKPSQQFVMKLREMGERFKPELKIHMVFVNAWSPANVDIEAWIKSSELSGADHMFVLTFKQDKALFDSLKKAASGSGMKARLVFMEYLSLKTLYSDVLIELQRGG